MGKIKLYVNLVDHMENMRHYEIIIFIKHFNLLGKTYETII